MRYKRKLIIIATLVALLFIVQFIFPGSSFLASGYNRYVFQPYQSLRNILFGSIPFSIGDMLYMAGALALIVLTIRWAYFIVRFRSHRHYLGRSLLNTFIISGLIYLLFFAGWGGNYYKPSLMAFWKLKPGKSVDIATLAAYDRYLIGELNLLAPGYQPMAFHQVDIRAQQYFRAYTDSRTRMHGLNAKPSAFGYFMQYLGIQGYYNPFTGEAQVNRFLPSFMLPFVVCHEMAHQSGIAAEDDANLLSYALCTVAPDKAFSYSGYFNLWLYTHNRLVRTDSTLAHRLMLTLNDVSRSQLDTLRQIRRRYHSDMSRYSSELYDSYLRMHNQKDGIDSYFKVIFSAMAWEKQKSKPVAMLLIP